MKKCNLSAICKAANALVKNQGYSKSVAFSKAWDVDVTGSSAVEGTIDSGTGIGVGVSSERNSTAVSTITADSAVEDDSLNVDEVVGSRVGGCMGSSCADVGISGIGSGVNVIVL